MSVNILEPMPEQSISSWCFFSVKWQIMITKRIKAKSETTATTTTTKKHIPTPSCGNSFAWKRTNSYF